jgi:phosphoserine aminotransferase
MVPYNFLTAGKFAEYVITDTWSSKALKDAKLIGDARESASGEKSNYTVIPRDFKVDPQAEFLHITTNNTIRGTAWTFLPETGDVPIFADMSSDILSRKIDWPRFGLIYAGAQKNLAPAGLTLVIIRKDILEKANKKLPAYLRFDLHADNNSLYNTPPMFQIYFMKLFLEWVKQQGGLAEMDKRAGERARIIYEAIDGSNGYYSSPAAKEDCSRMNICFRLPNEDLDKKFLGETGKRGMNGLKGHRSVGGCRVSLYNAMPIEGAKALALFMAEFKGKNPA